MTATLEASHVAAFESLVAAHVDGNGISNASIVRIVEHATNELTHEACLELIDWLRVHDGLTETAHSALDRIDPRVRKD